MSLLLILLPARPRWHPLQPVVPPTVPAGGAALAGAEFRYALSTDGRGISSEGCCAAALLPAASQTVLVIGDSDISFHRLTCPKAPPARMAAALAGLLEEALLDEPEQVHLALAPDSRPGQPTWVACCDRAWLTGALETLEQQHRRVDRVVPMLSPPEPVDPDAVPDPAAAHPTVRLHLHAAPGLQEREDALMVVTCVDARGVSTWPAQGSGARHWLRQLGDGPIEASASPKMAAQAEQWLGRPVQVRPVAERLLAAQTSPWQLRQFALAPRHRGLAVLRERWQRLRSPDWRPVRWGLAALVAVQLIGLNAWAWHERRGLQQRREAVMQIMRSSHPQVRAILDAPIQMQRENDRLRAAAGRPGDSDLEPMLQAAATAWPGSAPAQSLRYTPGELTLTGPGLDETGQERMRTLLQPSGWQVEARAGSVTLRRLPAATRPDGSPR
ncbi:type II secretion system protein L (GspL) [Sphaerotilus hippei]|uniref:Type II secretion system protein L (GspL) n=1 Tax=Sphaerotilus hippei TaxID=744406 RepID=A0A318H4Y0_9BURK|nr:type II secretion system protein GspL [Sphaerotilus hippei]PXW97106.1 type II secretion system protein L (GspL) [Sphaerotilus hippei]